MISPKRHWILVKVPFYPESAEAVGYYLFEHGTLGCEEKESQFLAYFEDQNCDKLLAAIKQDARQIIAGGLKLPPEPITIERIPEEDWYKGWQQFFKPINIENKLFVRPSWEKVTLPKHAVEILLEPKQAFGTGSHATTKLMLQAIVARKNSLPVCALDVGTGSGILAIAHALLNPQAQILGCDIDPIAIENAIENAQINGVADRIGFLTGGVGAINPAARFPLIYSNLQRHIIMPILPKLAALLFSGGNLLLSGILDSEEEMLRTALAEFPLAICAVRQEDEWILIEVRKEK